MEKDFQILKIPTAPGHENLVAGWIKIRLKQMGISFREDAHGNLVATWGKRRKGDGIAYSVHMDHPGFVVRRVTGKKLECNFLGGVPPSYFKKGVAVEIFDPKGQVAAQAKVASILEWNKKQRRILLDLVSGEVLRGYFGMWKLPVLRIDHRRNLLINRVCDDLAGCAAVLTMLSRLSRLRNIGTGYAIFTRREEIGLEGAFEVARSRLIPKSIPIISVETSRELCNARQGDGVIVRVGDRSSIFDPQVTARLCQSAEKIKAKKEFLYQRRLMDGGTCESTAYMESGYAAGGLCVALGNYHNCSSDGKIAAESIHLDDWKGMVQLMVECCQ